MSKKANEQAIVWLKSMCESESEFDRINAENCLVMIQKLRKQNQSLGAHFCNLKKQRNRLLKQQKAEAETELLKASSTIHMRMILDEIAPMRCHFDIP